MSKKKTNSKKKGLTWMSQLAQNVDFVPQLVLPRVVFGIDEKFFDGNFGAPPESLEHFSISSPAKSPLEDEVVLLYLPRRSGLLDFRL